LHRKGRLAMLHGLRAGPENALHLHVNVLRPLFRMHRCARMAQEGHWGLVLVIYPSSTGAQRLAMLHGQRGRILLIP
jgi:hypothetical protein